MSEEVMIPKSYHDKVCEEMARRHQAEILELSADRPQGENLLEEYPPLFECSIYGASCFDTIPWDCNIIFCPSCGARMKGADDE